MSDQIGPTGLPVGSEGWPGPNAIDDHMAEFNARLQQEGIESPDWTAEELAQQTRLAKQHNALDFAPKYPQNESSRVIQASSYGYALFAELKKRHRAEVQTLAEYGQDRVKREATAWRETPYDRNDPLAPPSRVLIVASDPSWEHPLDDRYDVAQAVPSRVEQCDVAITDQCGGAVNDELVMEHNHVLGFWNICDVCQSWLLGMARVERESTDDRERRAKHYREVLTMYGNATRDLTPLMRREV